MKVYFVDDIFVIHYYEKKIEEIKKETIEHIIKPILLKIKKIYNIKFEGYYIVNVYLDSYYGIVFEIIKEDLDYFFNDTVEMQINIMEDHGFLYQIEEIPSFKGNIYEKDGKLYFELKEKLNFIEYGKLLEISTIVYDEEVIEIKKNKILRW